MDQTRYGAAGLEIRGPHIWKLSRVRWGGKGGWTMQKNDTNWENHFAAFLAFVQQ